MVDSGNTRKLVYHNQCMTSFHTFSKIIYIQLKLSVPQVANRPLHVLLASKINPVDWFLLLDYGSADFQQFPHACGYFWERDIVKRCQTVALVLEVAKISVKNLGAVYLPFLNVY